MKIKSFLLQLIDHPFIPKSFVCFIEGYSLSTFRKDVFAGLTVGIIAIPLSMAFAIASGVEPSKGLYTAVIAGFLVAVFGGSRVQVAGPTGAFVVIIYSTLQKHGFDGLVVATLMAAVILIFMGFFRVGQLIRFVPYPLIIGFTAALALLIFTAQIKEFFGFPITSLPSDFIGKWSIYFSSFSNIHFLTLGIGSMSLGIILCIRRFFPSLPWGIIAIICATLVTTLFHLDVETIYTRYGEFPSHLPSLSMPKVTWSLAWFQSLLPDAFAIAILAALESLLSALMADGMIGKRHKSDCELIGQGIANCASVLFGGIPATGAISRTAVNVNAGAKTPVAGIVHAAVVLGIMLLAAPLVGQIPLAALSAVLMVVAWNMAETHRFFHLLRAPKGDIAVMLTAFLLTLLSDLALAVQTAMLLALFLFMKKMSEKGSSVKIHLSDTANCAIQPIDVYELHGPLFFGMVDRIRELGYFSQEAPKVFVLWIHKTPILDASGMHALIELSDRCKVKGTKLLLAGIHEETKTAIQKFGLTQKIGQENLFEHVDDAMLFAKTYTDSK